MINLTTNIINPLDIPRLVKYEILSVDDNDISVPPCLSVRIQVYGPNNLPYGDGVSLLAYDSQASTCLRVKSVPQAAILSRCTAWSSRAFTRDWRACGTRMCLELGRSESDSRRSKQIWSRRAFCPLLSRGHDLPNRPEENDRRRTGEVVRDAQTPTRPNHHRRARGCRSCDVSNNTIFSI